MATITTTTTDAAAAEAAAPATARTWVAPVVAAAIGGIAAALATWGFVATQTLQMSVGAGF
jgi:hypothetical protein